jgi:anthranilate phosphoribosyltransferase
VTIYAIGDQAVLVLIGDEGLDTARLHRESQVALDAIGALINGSPHSKAFLLTSTTRRG